MAKKSNTSKIILFSILALAVVGVGGAVWYQKNKDKSVSVTVEPVSRRTITRTVNSSDGKIQPETLVKISSEASGEIIFLGCKEGDRVKKGQLLVRIRPDIVETQLEQSRAGAKAAKAAIGAAKAEFDRATQDLERISALYAKKFVAKEEFDRAQAAVQSAQSRYDQALRGFEQAQAALKQTEAQASRTTIYSPIDGVVTSLSMKVGEKVVGTATMQGTEIMQIADLTVMNAWVNVDENDIVNVSLGDTARIDVDAIPGQTFTGLVYQLGNSAKAKSAGTQDEVVNFEVRIRLISPDDRFRPGMSCNATIETETRSNVLAVPLQAVTVRQSQKQEETSNGELKVEKVGTETTKKQKRSASVVFVNQNNTAKMVSVETGISDNGYIEIKNGLSEGQSVISGSFQAITKELEDGSKTKLDSLTQSWKSKKK